MSGSYYFSYFPQTTYESFDGSNKAVTDIFKRAKMTKIASNIKGSIFYKYTIQDGERPEDIAIKFYGDTQYYWIVLYANEIINIYAEWPKSTRDFENFIIEKYGSFEDAMTVVHHYEDSNGNWISLDAFDPATSSIISMHEYEYRLNEDKREINIVRSEYLQQIIQEMNKIFS